ncbi:MAG: UTP--glucose-1-phosphate uridylyltransferase GalU [Candidatus Thermoplasmatota archaeon]|nr:UTP--glucose-1-phosphate uridylyltransferase GalU [bacterium]MBU1941649.1 UTP--glucose-1-phosphate uridylyltransferase GalU [Candidatus Thermoplasmatota archaeon]
MKCVIPAAGFGTRFLPMTKNSPKEMLPLVDKPAIQYVIEEAVDSGINDILIITGRGKRAIEDHFDIAFELEYILKDNKDEKKLREIRKIAELADIHYVRQKQQLGLGHAVLCAEKHVGTQPFAVLLGDDIVFSTTPCTKQLIQQYNKHKVSIIAVEPVPDTHIHTYGVIKYDDPIDDKLYPIVDLVEKPTKEQAPSNLGILGRYILTPAIFDCIRNTKPGYGGEIQLTDALKELLKEEPIYAYEFYGTRYDLGNKMDWLKTTIDVALMRQEFREELLEFLKQKITS